MNRKILVIDDDPDLASLVQIILKPLGLDVYSANSGVDGLKQVYQLHPDLVILDIMMPGMNGFEVCSRLREFCSIPIVMLTARTNDNDMMHGFNVGANDYLKKPFSKTELEARVSALLRRTKYQKENDLPYVSTYNDQIMEINLSSKTVKIMGNYIDLSPKEFDLLACLVREQGVIFSHRQLVREAWGDRCYEDPSGSSLYIHYLRKKLKDGQYGHHYIRTQWGRGYWFEPRMENHPE